MGSSPLTWGSDLALHKHSALATGPPWKSRVREFYLNLAREEQDSRDCPGIFFSKSCFLQNTLGLNMQLLNPLCLGGGSLGGVFPAREAVGLPTKGRNSAQLSSWGIHLRILNCKPSLTAA